MQDDFVQIKELRPDGLLWDLIRVEDFGARVRNACIVGSVKAYKEDPTLQGSGTVVKEEDEDVQMEIIGATPTSKTRDSPLLPPQFILLQLDNGTTAFLSLQRSERGKLEFVSSIYRVPKTMHMLQPGKHLAVDPSSRYMAIGCSEGLFAICALYSREELKKQYATGSRARHVESETQIFTDGNAVIHKMEFLYPSADDDTHIILLLLTIHRGKTRMLVYEWFTGDNLNEVRSKSKRGRGHLLEASRQMPQLLIPLTIKSSFIIVSETSMAVCQGILEGQPTFIDFNNSSNSNPPTELHHGSGSPLWIAWARPARLESYRVTRDDIYIVREDGVITFLETDVMVDEYVKAYNNIGKLGANCGTALASLDYQNYLDSESGDLLITGGDSCAGGVYLVGAFYLHPVFEFDAKSHGRCSYQVSNKQSLCNFRS